ncbi:MAG: HipA domain-containing protein [Lachnospiraceae bacterium]|nr:HipA domain-containing protein [Lachnospiraceae bacterium]
MRDYSIYERTPVMFSGAEKKFEILIKGHRYIVKFQKNSEVGLLYNHVSEYLGSHIFGSVGIPVQETFLGTYDGQNVVVLKNFLGPEDTLVSFNGVGESSLERDKELYQYTYEDIISMLRENTRSTHVEETIHRFWDMFIIDALIGNFDRHGGNWGFVRHDNTYRMAPVYDNGSCLYPRANTDAALERILASEEEISQRIYKFPTSHIKIGNRKSSYYEVISSRQFDECNKALARMLPRIDFEKINAMIDGVEGITDVRRRFYKVMLQQRFDKILMASYRMLKT